MPWQDFTQSVLRIGNCCHYHGEQRSGPATGRLMMCINQPIRVYSPMKLHYCFMAKNCESCSVNITDVKAWNHDISWETYNSWTLSSIHRSSSWTLDNWLLWRNLPKQVLTMIYVKESVTHVTTHPCCKYTVYQQFPQLNSYDYSVFWKVTLGKKIKVLQ